MKSINNVFVKNIKKILFKENKSRKFLIDSLLKEDTSVLVSIWDSIYNSNIAYKNYKIDVNNGFKIELIPLFEDFKIISVYLPYAINENDYLIFSFINNHPERMFFSGIELIKEKIIDNYKKSYILINCFSYWKDNKTHFRNVVISNDFKIFEIYYKVYLENIEENDSLYIPIKEDYDTITTFFMNVCKEDMSECIRENQKHLSNYDLAQIKNCNMTIEEMIQHLFSISLQLSVKKGEISIVPSTIFHYVKYIEEHTSWLNQNKDMFYYSHHNFISFYYNFNGQTKLFLCNIIYNLLCAFPSVYEFINIDSGICCLS